MSRICVFNTAVDKDTANQTFISNIPINTPLAPGLTKPVRVLGAEQAAIEFIFTGSYPGAIFELRWWREFWGDDVSHFLGQIGPTTDVPSGRVVTGIPAAVPWSREVVNVAAADGSVSSEPAERKTTLIIPDGKPGVAVWMPLPVFAPWMHIALYAPAQVVPGPGDLGDGVYNVLIAVHVGGHAEDNYLDDPVNNNRPYAYTARVGSIL